MADTTVLNLANATTGASNTPVSMQFPITRTGDLGYDAIVYYHTVDSTAVAGVDYTAVRGSVVVPAGVASATIPVTINANTNTGASKQLLMFIDNAVGIGPEPSFGPQQTFPAGLAPWYVTATDVNGDGMPDLIVANNTSDTVSVLLNTAVSGATVSSFAIQQSFAAGRGCSYVTTADVNGDGKPDLIVANYYDGTVSVLLNTTDPGATTLSFAPQQAFVAGSNPNAVAIADVNGDGKPDLIVANYGSNTISVLLNTTVPGATTPSFAAQRTFPTGSSTNPYSITTADVNGDGKTDLLVADFGSNTVSVLLNTTAPGSAVPSFAAPQTFATGLGPSSITTADVNGDGKPDLIVTNDRSNTVSVLLNTTAPGASTPSFAAQQTFATGLGPSSIATADVNGDGKPDLIVADYRSNTISVLLNATATGATTLSFGPQQTFATDPGPIAITTANLNGEGKPDLIVANDSGNTVSVLLNTQYQAMTTGSPAIGTIVYDYIFVDGFGP